MSRSTAGLSSTDECEFKTLLLKDDNVYAEFIEDGKSLKKCFDGTSTFK